VNLIDCKVLLEAEPGGTGSYLHTLSSAWVDARHRASPLGDRSRYGRCVRTLRTTPMKWWCAPETCTSRSPQRAADRADSWFSWFRSSSQGARVLDQADAPALGLVHPAVLCLGIFTSCASPSRSAPASLAARASAWPIAMADRSAGLPLRHPRNASASSCCPSPRSS